MQLFLLLIIISPLAAAPWTVGNSGAPGTQSCASSCHGEGEGTVEVIGFPSTYYLDSTYAVYLISHGSTIKNFNASCRVGTTSLTAGFMYGDGVTQSYSVPAELNGVHSTVLDQDTFLFYWHAPVHLVGGVTLYIAAHEGDESGANNDLILPAAEADVPDIPDRPSHPVPDSGRSNVSINTHLYWGETFGADSFWVYFGTTENPPLVSRQTEIEYDPGLLAYNTEYFWKVWACNEDGCNEGLLWNFFTEQNSSNYESIVNEFALEAPFPNPFNGTTTLRIKLAGNASLTVDIFDVQGRLVERLFSGRAQHGQNEFTWHASGAAGVYFIRTDINHSHFIHKVLYLK